MRWRGIIVFVVALIVIVPVAIISVMVATFNPNRYKPQVIAAFERATHRQLTIAGSLRLSGLFTPTVSAEGVTLLNPPGFPDPDLMSLKRIEARVALLPLLTGEVDITRLVLDDPQIRFERNAAGQGNWLFASVGSEATRPTSAPPSHKNALKVALQSVTVHNATITYVKAPKPITVMIGRLDARANSVTSPLHFAMSATVNHEPISASGTVGPIARLTGVLSQGAWPINVKVLAGSAMVHVSGNIQQPRAVSGVDFAIDGDVGDLSALDAYLPGMSLPPIRNVQLHLRLTLARLGDMPAVTDLRVAASNSDLGSWRAGLLLTRLDLGMTSLDKPLNLSLAGQYHTHPLTFRCTVGPLGAVLEGLMGIRPSSSLVTGQQQSTMVNADLRADLGNATLSATGGMATPMDLAGVAIKVAAQVPDLRNLEQLIGMKLPNLTNLAVSALLTDRGQGLRHAIGVNSLAISANQMQLDGSADLTFGSTPRLKAIVNMPRLDLSAFLGSTANSAVSVTNSSVEPQPQQARVPAARALPQGVIPTTPIPFSLLRRGDADVDLSIGDLRYQGTNYRTIVAHAVLSNGKLTIRPFSAKLPGGAVSTSVTVDTGVTPPAVSANVAIPSFDVKNLLMLLGISPQSANGRVAFYATLSGAGNSAHAIASRLDGAMGLSMVNGTVGGEVLNSLFGKVLTSARLPGVASLTPGPVAVRCFAARLDSKSGLGTLSAFTLDSSRLLMQGTGTVAFGSEALDLVLQPHLLVAGQSVPVPIAITGTFRKPQYGHAPPGAYAASLAPLASRVAAPTGNSVLTQFAQALGLASKSKSPAAPGSSCVSQLSLARLGHPGPLPAAVSAPAAPVGTTTPAPTQSGPQNLLRSLLK